MDRLESLHNNLRNCLISIKFNDNLSYEELDKCCALWYNRLKSSYDAKMVCKTFSVELEKVVKAVYSHSDLSFVDDYSIKWLYSISSLLHYNLSDGAFIGLIDWRGQSNFYSLSDEYLQLDLIYDLSEPLKSIERLNTFSELLLSGGILNKLGKNFRGISLSGIKEYIEYIGRGYIYSPMFCFAVYESFMLSIGCTVVSDVGSSVNKINNSYVINDRFVLLIYDNKTDLLLKVQSYEDLERILNGNM